MRIRHFTRFTFLYVIILSSSVHVLAADSIANIKQYNLALNNEISNSSIKLLAIGQLTNISINGFKVSELSGLAWDEDEKILYTLSDNGYLFHLRPAFNKDQLIDVQSLAGFALRDENNKPLGGKYADSEGITIEKNNNGISGDTTLLICFEGNPRVVRYYPNGDYINTLTLPDMLSDTTRYHGKNKSLEAISLHDQYGILVGTEYPLKETEQGMLSIYSIQGNDWHVPAINKDYGALVDMTVLEDGSILLLERAYTWIWPEFDVTLHRVTLSENDITHELIARFAPGNDLFNDNFEGITIYRNNYLFMISDDNNHPLKRTLLIYFCMPDRRKTSDECAQH